MGRISVRTTKKVKKVVRREWTPNDVRVLKKHSKAKTPIEKISRGKEQCRRLSIG
jgi:hypothetical protein